MINAPILSLFDEQNRFLGSEVAIIPYALSGTNELKTRIESHINNCNNAFIMQNHGALVLGHDIERAMHIVAILEKYSIAFLLPLLTERKITRIPEDARTLMILKIQEDQRKSEHGETGEGGE